MRDMFCPVINSTCNFVDTSQGSSFIERNTVHDDAYDCKKIPLRFRVNHPIVSIFFLCSENRWFERSS